MENKTPQTPATNGPTFALKYCAIAVLVAFALGIWVGISVHAKFNPCVVVPTISVQRDTISVRDTVQGKIVPPVIRTIIRRDTLVLPSKRDTARQRDTTVADTQRSPQAYYLPSGGISVPIEQRVYATDQYRAVVSGWHPSLDSITLYPVNTTIRETITKLAQPPRKNWAFVVGPSVTCTTQRTVVLGGSAVFGFVIR